MSMVDGLEKTMLPIGCRCLNRPRRETMPDWFATFVILSILVVGMDLTARNSKDEE